MNRAMIRSPGSSQIPDKVHLVLKGRRMSIETSFVGEGWFCIVSTAEATSATRSFKDFEASVISVRWRNLRWTTRFRGFSSLLFNGCL
jgi:hypothetical protein